MVWTRRMAALVVCAVVAASCEPGYAIWVIAGSTAEHLVLGLATERDGHKTNPLWLIEVDQCDRIAPDLRLSHGSTMWRAQGRRGSGLVAISRATYGQPIPGLRDSVLARPLTSGCYLAWVATEPAGSGRVTFWIDPNGTARDLTRAESDSMAALAKRHSEAEFADADSAIARCKRAYADARTPADSSHVNAEELNDTVHLGHYTCAWFREYYRSDFEKK